MDDTDVRVGGYSRRQIQQLNTSPQVRVFNPSSWYVITSLFTLLYKLDCQYTDAKPPTSQNYQLQSERKRDITVSGKSCSLYEEWDYSLTPSRVVLELFLVIPMLTQSPDCHLIESSQRE